MKIQELKKGDSVTVEIMWGESSYELASKVIYSLNNDVFIEPFMYKNSVVDLGKNISQDMFYNIYAVDKDNNQRVQWKNVRIEMVTLKNGKAAYSLKTYQFAKNSITSERRTQERTVVNVPDIAYIEGKRVPIAIRDISSSGCSITCSSGVDIPSGNFEIEFSDIAKDEAYTILLQCKVVRRNNMGIDGFFGCQITQENKDLLFYMFHKRIDLQRNRQ